MGCFDWNTAWVARYLGRERRIQVPSNQPVVRGFGEGDLKWSNAYKRTGSLRSTFLCGRMIVGDPYPILCKLDGSLGKVGEVGRTLCLCLISLKTI